MNMTLYPPIELSWKLKAPLILANFGLGKTSWFLPDSTKAVLDPVLPLKPKWKIHSSKVNNSASNIYSLMIILYHVISKVSGIQGLFKYKDSVCIIHRYYEY